MTLVSPDWSQEVQGMMTPASLQPAPEPEVWRDGPGEKMP